MKTDGVPADYVPVRCRGPLQIAVDHQYALYKQDHGRPMSESFGTWMARHRRQMWVPRVIDGRDCRL